MHDFPIGTAAAGPSSQNEEPTRMPAAIARTLVLMAVLCLLALSPAAADNALFVVTGVAVDVKADTAAAAKKQALGDVQVTAFRMLAERLGGSEAAGLADRFDIKDVGRLLKSLSIEDEHTGPGRYFGRLTVRFLPDKVRRMFTRAGISWTEQRSARIVVVPLWKGENGPMLWEDNLWRRAWLSLGAENALVPLLVPLGDLSDAQTFSLDDALNGNEAKLEAIRIRYQGESILVAEGSPAGDNGVHITAAGPTPVGNVLFDKTYTLAEGGVAAAAEAAVRRFHTLLTDRWRAGRATANTPGPAAQSLSVAVPFASLEEWNMIRSGLLATPGVAGADIATLAQGGAIVTLAYTVPFETLQSSLYQGRLSLQQAVGGWVLQPF